MSNVPVNRPEPYKSDSYNEHPKDLPVWFMLLMSAIVILVLFGGLALLFSTVEWAHEAYTEFDRRDAIIESCLDSDRYTRQECIMLAGSK